jgi:hypothetical protein
MIDLTPETAGASTLASCTGYLSVSTSERDGLRYWRVIGRDNQPRCADTLDLRHALEVARKTFGSVTLAVWDGDKGEFTGETATDPVCPTCSNTRRVPAPAGLTARCQDCWGK